MDKVLAAFLALTLAVMSFGAKQLWELSSDVAVLKAQVKILMRSLDGRARPNQ